MQRTSRIALFLCLFVVSLVLGGNVRADESDVDPPDESTISGSETVASEGDVEEAAAEHRAAARRDIGSCPPPPDRSASCGWRVRTAQSRAARGWRAAPLPQR